MFMFQSVLLAVAVDLRYENSVALLLVGNHSSTVAHHLLMNNVLVLGHSGNMTLCATKQSHAATMHLLIVV
jgi:hypothetical protein